MKAKAKVSADEMLQLTEVGVPAWQILADAVGKSTAEVMKLSEKGLIPADQAIDALVSGMEKKFPNMMAKLSTSMGGTLSNLQDFSERAGRELGEGLFEQIKPALQNALKSLEELRKSGQIEQWGKNIGSAFGFIVENADKLVFSLKALATGFLISKAINTARVALDAFKASEIATTAATNGLTAALMKNPFGLILVGLSLLIPKLIEGVSWYKRMTDFSEDAAQAEKYHAGTLGELAAKQQHINGLLEKGTLAQDAKTRAQEALNETTNQMRAIMPDVIEAYKAEGVYIDQNTGKIYGNTQALLQNVAAKRAAAHAEVSRIQMEIGRLQSGNVLINMTPYIDESKLSVEEKATGVIKNNVEAISGALAIHNTFLKEAQAQASRMDAEYNAIAAAVDKTRINTGNAAAATSNFGAALESTTKKAASALDDYQKKLAETRADWISSLSNIGKSVASSFGTGGKEGLNELVNMIEDLKIQVQSLAEAGDPVGRALVQSLNSALSTLPDAISDQTGKAAEHTLAIIRDVSSRLIKYSGESAAEVEINFKRAWRSIEAAVHQHLENIRADMADFSISGLSDLAKTIAENIGSGSEEARIKIADMIEDIRLGIQSLADAGDPVAQAIVQSLTSALALLPAAMADITGEAGNQMLAIIKDITQRLAKYSGDAANVISLDIARAFRDASRAAAQSIAEIKAGMADFTAEAADIYERMQDEIAAANEDYYEKVDEINKRTAEDIQKVQEDFQKTLEDTTKRLRDWTGLFDEVPKLATASMTKMIKNLRDQVDRFDLFYQLLGKLAERGVDEGLIAELREMGPKAADEIMALYRASDDELDEYVELWKEKNRLAAEEATEQLEDGREDMLDEIQQIIEDAEEKLENLREEWRKKLSRIREEAGSELQGLAEDAKQYGNSFVLELLNGLEEKYPELATEIEKIKALFNLTGGNTGGGTAFPDQLAVGGQLEKLYRKWWSGTATAEELSRLWEIESDYASTFGYRPSKGLVSPASGIPSGGTSGGSGGSSGGGSGGGGSGGGAIKTPKYIFTPSYYRMIGDVAALKAIDFRTYGVEIGWDEATRRVLVNGQHVAPLEIDSDNRAWIGIRKVFQDILGREVEWKPDGTIYVYHGGGMVSKLGPREVPIIAEEGEVVLGRGTNIVNVNFTELISVMKELTKALKAKPAVSIDRVFAPENVYVNKEQDWDKVGRQLARDIMLAAGG